MSYHTKSSSSLHTPLELNPLFITGFTDREGSFSISKKRLQQIFFLGQVSSERPLLEKI